MTSPAAVVAADGTRLFGRFAARPTVVDPLAARSRVPRALRALRLKQWVGWTLVHPDWACSMILQDAGYLASAELYLARRSDGAAHGYAANASGGSLRLPLDLFAGRAEFSRGGFGLEYRFSRERGEHRISVDLAAHDDTPALVGELVLDARPAAASADLAVSARLPGGTLYTTKALFPVGGSLRLGDDEVVFDPGRDVAILDEHRSQLPYRTWWTWGTFAWHDEDGLVGANLATRPAVAGQEEECGLWSPGRCEPLTDVTFTPAPGADPLRPWTVAARDGRVDVVFTPEGHKDVDVQLGVVAMRYRQRYGRYRGALVTGGAVRTVADVPGVLEDMHARL